MKYTKTTVFLALLFCAVPFVSCSSDDETTTISEKVWYGNFSVAGTAYTEFIIRDDYTYAMTGSTDGEDDSGTWSVAANYQLAMTRQFTSKKHEGTFYQDPNSWDGYKALTSGTITASGSGVNFSTFKYVIDSGDGHYNGSALPDGSTETFYLNTDKTVRMVGSGNGSLSAVGTYEINVAKKTITISFTSGDVIGTMAGTYESEGSYFNVSSQTGLKVYGKTATLSGKANRQQK